MGEDDQIKSFLICVYLCCSVVTQIPRHRLKHRWTKNKHRSRAFLICVALPALLTALLRGFQIPRPRLKRTDGEDETQIKEPFLSACHVCSCWSSNSASSIEPQNGRKMKHRSKRAFLTVLSAVALWFQFRVRLQPQMDRRGTQSRAFLYLRCSVVQISASSMNHWMTKMNTDQ